MKTNLTKATKNLYDVFKKYTVEGNLRDRSCDCCITNEEIKALLARDMRVLTEDEIGYFMRSAITTFGDVTDYKHFLPRILELMQINGSDILYDFTTYEKLNYTKWKSWDIIEVSSIQDYFIALWTASIHKENVSFSEMESTLTLMFMYVGWDKTLAIWEKSEQLNSIHYMVDIVLNNNYYNFSKEEIERLFHWFSSDKILSKIEKVFLETKDKLEANRISIAYTLLENMK